MDPLNSKTCKGNWGTLLLPINLDDSIDFDILSEEIDQLIAAGVDGIYSNGTAGEFHTQTEEEFDFISEVLAQKCSAAKMPFQIGASHLVPKVMFDRIRRTKSLAPSAYQVILPDWVALNNEEAHRFLHTVVDAANPIPIVLYNPPHAKRVLTPDFYKRFYKKTPGLISVKLLDGDKNWYNSMKSVSEDMAIFVPGHHLATGVQNGVAAGAYSNVACLNPKGAQQWWNIIQNDIEEALHIESNIQDFFKACIVPFANAGYSNPALDKLLAATGAWARISTRLRWPYQWIAESEVAGIRKVAEKYLPGWFFDDF